MISWWWLIATYVGGLASIGACVLALFIRAGRYYLNSSRR